MTSAARDEEADPMRITGSLGFEVRDADAALRRLAELLRPYLTDAHDEPDEALLTADQIAGQLRVHRDTVVRWARERRISATKVGREWRFPAGAKPRAHDRQATPTSSRARAAPRSAEPASLAAIRGGKLLQ
jgi:excisionase family DNA binding protein